MDNITHQKRVAVAAGITTRKDPGDRSQDNRNIHEDISSMKTLQKAVLNALIQCDLASSTQGSRHIALDNHYQCPELAFLLREKYRVLSTNTVRSNQIGWASHKDYCWLYI